MHTIDCVFSANVLFWITQYVVLDVAEKKNTLQRVLQGVPESSEGAGLYDPLTLIRQAPRIGATLCLH